MSFVVQASKGGGGASEQVPAGNHPAVLVGLVDCGTQHEEFQGTASWKRQLLLVWQLPTKKRSDGRPHVLDAVVTLSLNEKAKLRKWAEALTGAPIPDGGTFDVSTLLGKACMLGVKQNEKGYARVDTVAAFPDLGVPAPAATVPAFSCTLDEFRGGKSLPEWLPWQWSRAVGQRVSVPDFVRLCREIAGDGSRAAPKATAAAALEDAPF